LCEIDHRDGKRDHNWIDNLREATHGENQQNQGKHRNTKSGFSGVTWYNRSKCWRARIDINHKQLCLGYFADPKDAAAAYLSAKQKLHTFNPIPRKIMEETHCEA
jgi:hypothetical protein